MSEKSSVSEFILYRPLLGQWLLTSPGKSSQLKTRCMQVRCWLLLCWPSWSPHLLVPPSSQCLGQGCLKRKTFQRRKATLPLGVRAMTVLRDTRPPASFRAVPLPSEPLCLQECCPRALRNYVYLMNIHANSSEKLKTLFLCLINSRSNEML